MEINISKLMKTTADSVIDNMMLPTQSFNSNIDAANHYHENLDNILQEFQESFKIDFQAYIAKEIAEASE